MNGGAYEIKRKGGVYWFNLLAPNSQVVLQSEVFGNKSAMLKTLNSVKLNSQNPQRFKIITKGVAYFSIPQDEEHYFTLSAGNHTVIGRSSDYFYLENCNKGIELVKKYGNTSKIIDLT